MLKQHMSRTCIYVGEGTEILFHLSKSSRKIPKCFRDVRIHTGHPCRESRYLSGLRFEVYKLREKGIELFIRSISGAGAHAIEVVTRTIRRANIRR